MTNKFSFNKLYWNPSLYVNDYEKGISYGKFFLTDKLIKILEEEEDALPKITNILFDFQKRSKNLNVFEENDEN